MSVIVSNLQKASAYSGGETSGQILEFRVLRRRLLMFRVLVPTHTQRRPRNTAVELSRDEDQAKGPIQTAGACPANLTRGPLRENSDQVVLALRPPNYPPQRVL